MCAMASLSAIVAARMEMDLFEDDDDARDGVGEDVIAA